MNSSRLIASSTAWTDISSNFDTVTLIPGTYFISAQFHFTRGTSTQTFVGVRMNIGGTIRSAAEKDFYRSATLNCSFIVTVVTQQQMTIQVYASAANVVSVVASTMLAPVSQASPASVINVLKIG